MKKMLKKWFYGDDAVAAIEAGFLFPILVSIMLGVIDTGMGISANQKVIDSTHMVADLLARYQTITDAQFNDAIVAGELVIEPFTTVGYQYDAAGIEFIGATMVPTVEWRDTCGMNPNPNVTVQGANLGINPNDGVIAVSVIYTYQPIFTGFVIGNVKMEEVSYARGRSGGFVGRTGVAAPCLPI